MIRVHGRFPDSSLVCALVLTLAGPGCGPPTFDVRSLASLPRVARAPAAEAERMLIAARRHEARGESELAAARDATRKARLATERAVAGKGDLLFAQTHQSYLQSIEALRAAEFSRLRERTAVRVARHELAKATVARDNAIPEAVGIDLPAYEEAVAEARAELAETDEKVKIQRLQVSILKRALHTARVASLKAAAGEP